MRKNMLWLLLGVLSVSVGSTAMDAAVAADVLAWIPYVRITPEYDHVVEVLGGHLAHTATTDPEELRAALLGRTVLLIPEQQETDEETLEALGLAVAAALTDFLAQGGRIVGMSYSQGADDVLRGAGLWNVTDGYDVTGASLAVALPRHPLVGGVPVAFEGTDGSTDFLGLPDDAVVLVWDTFDEAPVVFTWETGGGTIVMLGFDLFEYTTATAQLLRNAIGVSAVVGDRPDDVSNEVVHDLGVADIEEMLVDRGLTFDRRTDSYDDPFWVLYLDAMTILLFVDDETGEASGRFQFLLLYAGWVAEGAVSCDLVNEWNRLARGSRAYLDSAGDVVLEADLYLHGGVTRDTLRQFFDRFERSVSRFETHVFGE